MDDGGRVELLDDAGPAKVAPRAGVAVVDRAVDVAADSAKYTGRRSFGSPFRRLERARRRLRDPSRRSSAAG